MEKNWYIVEYVFDIYVHVHGYITPFPAYAPDFYTIDFEGKAKNIFL